MQLFHSLLKHGSALFAKGKLSILIYHQVLEQPDNMRPTEPDAAVFRWQMSLVKRYFTPLSLTDAIQHLKNNTLPSNAICVTFDDGYENNLTVAQPILNELGIPATVYVATGFSQGENMFNDRIIDLIGDLANSQIDLTSIRQGVVALDSWQARRATATSVINAVKYLPIEQRKQLINQLYQDNGKTEYPARMMSAEQVAELSALGVEIGAHTVEHPILKSLSIEQQQWQIEHSQHELEAWIKKPVNHFAYPNGKFGADYSLDTVKCVKSCNFHSAVTTHRGISQSGSDLFQLNRFTPWDKSPLKFHLRLVRNQLGLL
ncbi:polysaccharide deacetylase family protein [Flocculibacter collagenilyticus]|uniref:polysaccharide deacetylase family protein n=1 Tax=Flocculibacter collagenilyticus TaxID=2744479 RepID=UPI0018F67F8F|nr:polysaccharide deacetylase family protein [Flocculibacter collagenilyticus]